MKQKRKVKSLLPQRNDGRGIFLTILLLVLGLVLCLGSASLMTTMVVGASSAGTDSTLSYSGVDDKVEVLYDLKFARPTNLKERVGWLFTKSNNDFYIKTKKSFPLVVNTEDFSSNNEVASGLYSNILGGSNNKILSGNNITIIGGDNQQIEAVGGGNSDNSVMLGGQTNYLRDAKTGGSPAIMVGGSNNQVDVDHDGVVVIGGDNQQINGEGSENVILIGGNRINVGENAKNVIVAGGNNIEISDGMENVFVFSNSSSSQFTPDTSNAFYLNVEKGLGVNVSAPGNYGLGLNGSVKVGGIDISNQCNSNNYGVIGAWDIGGGLACLVGCDARSANKWDLLDRSDVCVEACDNNANCDVFDLPVSGFTGQYVAICTSGVDTKYASPCNPNEWTQYKNVFYETALIDAKDAGGQCPGNDGTNKCVYQCNSGFHLTGDVTQSNKLGSRKGIIGCFRDCNLAEIINDQWTVKSGDNRSPIILKHNETILAYNMEEVACSYHRYEPPTDGPTSFKNYLDDGFGTKRWGGSFGIDRSNRYELPEHCGNNGHKQKLICVNGQVFIANDGTTPTSTDKPIIGSDGVGKWGNYPGYANSGYIYKDCRTAPYQCDTTQGRYDLTRDYIRTTLLETGHLDHSYFGGGVKDRNQVKGVRGLYQICYDYLTGDNYKKYIGPGLGNELCIIDTGAMGKYSNPYYGENGDKDNNDYLRYYHFVKCNEDDGYYPSIRTDDLAATNNNTKGKICRKSCVVHTADKGDQIVLDWDSIRLYKGPLEKCENGRKCDYKDFKCVEGKWEEEPETAGYLYLECKQEGHACDSSYNVTGYDYVLDKYGEDYHTGTSVYEGPCKKRYARFDDRKIDFLYTSLPHTKAQPWNTGVDPIDCSLHDMYKLIECVNCHHTTNGKYCEDEENLGEQIACEEKSGQRVVGYKYTQWTSTSYKGGTMQTEGSCYYYCDEGYYEYNGRCILNNPEPAYCSSEFKERIESYSGGSVVRTEGILSGENETEEWAIYTGTYYVEDGTGRKEMEETYICYQGCYGDYVRSNNTCVEKGRDKGCVGVVPVHAHVVNSGYQGTEYKAFEHIPENEESWYENYGDSNYCTFACDTGYVWDRYACIYSGWKCHVCSNTVTYNLDGGTLENLNVTKVDISCGDKIVLPGITKRCYKFDGWYIGTDDTQLYYAGSEYIPTAPVSFTAKWTRDTSTPGCEYKCEGQDGPGIFDSNIMEWNNAGLDMDGIQWQYISDYSATLYKCQWRCKPGYDHKGNTCVERKCGTGNNNPEPGNSYTIVGNSTYVGNDQNDKNRKWTFVDGATSVGPCEWTCREGYQRAKTGNTLLNYCEPKKCGGTPGVGAQVKTGSSEYVGVDTKERKAVTGTINPRECEWTCLNSGTDLYIPNEPMHRCDLVVDGKCTNGTGKKLNSKTCFKGNPGPTRTEGHKDVWDCLSPNGGQTDSDCFMCKTGWTGDNCELEIKAGKCVNTTLYACNPGTAINTGQNDSAHKYIWDCDGENGGAKDTGCFKCYPDYTPDSAGQCNYNPAPINGQCDTSHFGCVTGDPDEQLTGNLQWTWKCKNRHGGTDMSCSEPFPTYKVHFEPNKLEGSMSDQTMHMHTSEQLKANEFSKVGYVFDHWNIEADDSGTSYANRQTVINLTSVSGDTVTLYAISKCANGYTGINGNCEKIINGECGTGFNSCAAGTPSGATQTGADNQYWNSGIRGWQWICEGQNTGTPKECSAIWTCNGASSEPSCGGDSSCDPNQKPANGCEINRECILPAPGNNTTGGKATYTGDNNNKKYWSSGFKVDITNLGECEWGCIDSSYERDGETMNCKKKVCTGPCGTAEAGQELTCYPSSSVSCANTGSHCIGETRKCGNDKNWYSGSVQADFPVGNTNTGCSLVGSGCFILDDDGKSCVAKTYTVNYNCGSGTGNPASQTVVFGITSNVIGNVCTRANFKQKGWSADPNATDPTWGSGVVMNGILVSGCEDITLYAVYDEDSKFTVTFDSLGGSAVTGQSVYSGEKATKPSPDPVREHNPGTGCYIFTGWHTENPPMNLYNWDTKVTKDITLYAKWAGKKYNIVYDCGTGGTLTKSSRIQEVTYGIVSKLRTDGCIKTGYVLTGWAGNSNGVLKNWNLGDDMSDFLVEQCGELTVHAVWEGSPVCTGSIDNAHLVEGTDQDLTEETWVELYKDEQTAINNKCAYVCNEGFDYICVENACSCAVCEAGTYDPETNSCVPRNYSCDGYPQALRIDDASYPGGYRCDTIGNCYYSGSVLNRGVPEGGSIRGFNYLDSVPIGIGDQNWNCVTGNINNHMCQYRCVDGYDCVDGKCVSICPPTEDVEDFYGYLGYYDYDFDMPTSWWPYGNGGDIWEYNEYYYQSYYDGCYYTCGSNSTYGYHTGAGVSGCIKHSCNEDSLPNGPWVSSLSIKKIENPTGVNQDYVYNSGATSSTQGCYYKCNDDYGYYATTGVNGEFECQSNFCYTYTLPSWANALSVVQIKNPTTPYQVFQYNQNAGDDWPGCYYKCNTGNGYYAVTGADGKVTCVTNYCDSSTLPSWTNALNIEKIMNPTTTGQRYEYNPDATSSSSGCYYKCKGDYEPFTGSDGTVRCELPNSCGSLPEGVDYWSVVTMGVATEYNQDYEYNQYATEDSEGCYYKCADWYDPVTWPDGVVRCMNGNYCNPYSLPHDFNWDYYRNGSYMNYYLIENPQEKGQDYEFYDFRIDGGPTRNTPGCYYACYSDLYEPVTGSDGKIICQYGGYNRCDYKTLPTSIWNGLTHVRLYNRYPTAQNQEYEYDPDATYDSQGCYYNCYDGYVRLSKGNGDYECVEGNGALCSDLGCMDDNGVACTWIDAYAGCKWSTHSTEVTSCPSNFTGFELVTNSNGKNDCVFCVPGTEWKTDKYKCE